MRSKITVAIVLGMFTAAGSIASAQVYTSALQRIYVETGENTFQFNTALFSLEPGVKKHPDQMTGAGISARVGYQLTPGFSLAVEIAKNRAKGSGDWFDTAGLDPSEVPYAPVASGMTRIEIRSLMMDAEKSFHLWKTRPYVEFAGGTASFKTSFDGAVAAIDPSDGEPFTVLATDTTRRIVPYGALGAGVDVPVRPGFAFHAGYRWEGGSLLLAGIRFYPFHRPAFQ